ncbi:MAG: PQQ-binding-like beta-propeller repeat protein [Planctomycetota bacterium]|nr:PQQ-binding-like beta-propeller repeat protein [Planctomycetota bacterium]
MLRTKLSHRSIARILLAAALAVAIYMLLPTWQSAGAKDSSPTRAKATKPGDWPEWRGPMRDGKSIETGLLTEWPADGPELIWKADGIGEGFSSVSLQNGKIYTVGNTDDKTMSVTALRAADGEKIWTAPVAEAYFHGNGDGPRSTPTLDGNLLYLITPQGDVVCLKTSDGKEVWRRSLIKDFGGQMMSKWGYSESPLVDGERLLCTPGGRDATIVALSKRNGKEIWRSAVPDIGSAGKDGAAYSSIVQSNACGVPQYVQLLGRGVVGVDAKTGKFLWGYNRIAGGVANVPDPVVDGDHVFATTGYNDGGCATIKLVKDGKEIKVEELKYRPANEFRNHHGGVVLVDGHLYFGNGQNQGFPTCLEFLTLEPTWGKERGAGSGSAAVAYADGQLYFRYQNGVMALIPADPKEYKLTSSFKIPDSSKPSWPHPVIVGGRLYIREQDQLLVYRIK